MKILFDQGTQVPLREYLPGHNVDTAFLKLHSYVGGGLKTTPLAEKNKGNTQ